MITQNKAIANMSDYELTELIEICSEMFGTTLKQSAAGAFIFMLHQKFNFTIDSEILNACTEYASNPSPDFNKRFSPSLLASILVMRNKSRNPEYKKPESEDNRRFSSDDEKKSYYKQLFLTAVYGDFEAFCDLGENNFYKHTCAIQVWSFVAEKLKQKGIITQNQYDAAYYENEKLDRKISTIKQTFDNRYKSLVISAFKDMAMQGKHINEFIN